MRIDRLLARGPGNLDFRTSSIDGYTCRIGDAPARVLLVDDVFVTGARLFSAARALADGSHTVAGALAIARRVNRDWGGCQQMWDQQHAKGFTWDRSPLTADPDPVLLDALRSQ